MKHRRTIAFLFTFAILQAQNQVRISTSVSNIGQGRSFTTVSGGAAPRFDPDHVLVRFKNGAAHDFLPGSGPARGFQGNANLFRVQNPPGLSVAESVARYQANPNVQYAEPDFIVQAIFTPNDTLWPNQWDMVKIAAPTVWDAPPNTSNMVVAIIDTGIDFTHPDLQGNLWTNPADNVSHGFNCIGGTCNAGGSDDFGLGTHVAGTIGGVGNNSAGIAGLNWSIKLASFKFLDSNGSGQISDAVAAFQKILDLKVNQGINIRLTSNSWGGGGFSQALKDAMAAVENAGIIDICAAGNSNVNADITPMYPAAYDNRGIISVLASDAGDVGAGFTNFGLSSVDIAAPGVSTLSTVPTGACTLCDPSGYTYLSGTSMATPHVSGVAAALLAANPALSAAEARDIILDPASYDTLTDAKAMSTSSGGRLNFPKTLANPRLGKAITLNNFPSVSMGPDVVANAGNNVSLTANPSDPDAGDVAGLRTSWNKLVSTSTQWLFGFMLNSVFPNPSGGSVNFPAPSLGRVATVPYYAGVADNRGGGASGVNFVTVNPIASPGGPPSGTLSVSNPTPAVGETVTVNYPVSSSVPGAVNWDLWAAGLFGSSGICCYGGSSAGIIFNSAGSYRVRTQAIDTQLNLSSGNGVVVKVGGATNEPPLAVATLDKLSGPVPLTVNVDMSGSSDADGNIQWYYFLCANGFASASASPLGSCTLTQPGAYWLEFEIQDNSGQVDIISKYVVATPAAGGGGGDSTPPLVSISTPTENASVTGSVGLTASASDNSGTVSKVEYRLDSPAGTLIGFFTTSPYSVSWDTTTVSPGAHTLYANAFDPSNNMGTSAARHVTVTDTKPPSVSISAPAAGNVSGTVTLQATASDLSGIKQVVYRLDNSSSGTILGTATFSPYTVLWDSSGSVGGHTLYAIATDNANNTNVSAPVNVTVLAVVRPALTITSPAAGTVKPKSTVTIAASVSNSPTYAVAKVDFYVNNNLVCTDFTASYSCSWKVPAGTNKTYTIKAIATDTQNVAGPPATVAVTAK